eukprot:7137271-Karenia_brevis.AAC.1
MQAKFEPEFTSLCIDANADVGEDASEFIGNANELKQNDNGARFHSALFELGMVAINTFMGSGPTWSGSTGGMRRIDYICCQACHWKSVAGCRVDYHVNPATAIRDDHFPVATSFDLSAVESTRTRAGGKPRDGNAAESETNKQMKISKAGLACKKKREVFERTGWEILQEVSAMPALSHEDLDRR